MMKKSEPRPMFTPGPWIVRHTEDCRVINIYADEKRGGLKICTMHGSMDTVAQDNAPLIAAATEMYDTLAACESSLDIVLKDEITPEYIKEILQDIILTISHTLKNARGEE